MSPGDAEQAAAFVVEHVKRSAGARWRQGPWNPPFDAPTDLPAIHTMATTRLLRVERAVAQALVAWALGERRVVLLREVPRAREVLALQAEGARCVSLLGSDAQTAPHESPLAFALHDLCHLEKFVDPEHHAGQVGFFRVINEAFAIRGLSGLIDRYDQAFAADIEHVVADMNGSAVFLFAALKMKLKMAVRRALARSRGAPQRGVGPLDAEESAAFDGAIEELFEVLALPAPVRRAGREISTRRAAADSAATFLSWCERVARSG